MNKFIITTESSVDIPDTYINKYNIPIIKYPIFINDKLLDDNIPYSDFYKCMQNGSNTSTSQINTAEIIEFLESFLKQGLDIIHICMSSKLSGTYNNFCIVKDELENKYPSNHITIIDSISASVGQSILCIQAYIMQYEKNATYDEVINWININKHNVVHLFTVNELFYLHKGGRISKATSIIGTALGIKPILTVNKEGMLEMFTKVRGRKHALDFLNKKMESLIASCKHEFIGIAHAICSEDANYLKDSIKKSLGLKAQICELSPLTGTHCGPGLIVLSFIGKNRIC